MKQLRPQDLVELRARGDALRLLDVREAEEWEYCRIDGAEWKPLSAMASWEDEVASSGLPVVVYCHHGVRSARVCGRLRALGLEEAINLVGGIERWAVEVDPQLPRY